MRGWRADLAAALLGALAALALPPFTLLPVIFVAIPGLLALIDAAPGPSVALRRGLAFGFGHVVVGLYWITNAVLVMAAQFWWAVPLTVPALGIVLGLFIAIPCAAARLVPAGPRRVLVLAGVWVLADLARQFILTGFPWNLWGSVWEFPGLAGAVFMQPAAWIGVHGLTLLTVLLAAAPALGRRALLGGVAALLLWAGFGLARLHAPLPPSPGLSAVIVQGDVPETQKRDQGNSPDFAREIFARHLKLTSQAVASLDGRPAVVIWPETASPYWLEEDAPAREMIAQAMRPAIAGLIGSIRVDAAGAPHNSLIAVLPDGGIGAIYDKAHLVPFGEYMPSWFPVRLGPQGFVPGPGIRTLHVPGLPALGPLICYEAAFPAQVVAARDRPAMLVNITNDAWFGDSSGPRQHLAAARMRAVEEGLPLLRAANTGISAVIDARGRIVASLGLGRTGTVVAEIPPALPATPASRFGLAMPLLLATGACALGLGLGRKRRQAETVS